MNKILPGWNEYIKPHAADSEFWHSVWLSSGKPSCGPLFENMKSSQKNYKYAVRKLKRCNDKIQNDKFVKGILEDGRDIFQEIRRF